MVLINPEDIWRIPKYIFHYIPDCIVLGMIIEPFDGFWCIPIPKHFYEPFFLIFNLELLVLFPKESKLLAEVKFLM